MADDKGRGSNAGNFDMKAASTSTSPTTADRKRKGLMSRLWNGIFRHSEDFEKRLQDISKEEAAVLARMKKRSLSWKRMTRHLIMFSVIFEAIAVGYAIMTTRTLDMNWKMRAFRVLPMFVLPALSAAAYWTLVGFTKMCDRKDQKTLERLRAERQAKIDELKERTNYYTTQQLIQRYDSDPAAKAAAATVLASKLGADSGLTMYLGDESKGHASIGKSHDADHGQHGGLRNRKQYTRSNSTGSSPSLPQDEIRRPVSASASASVSAAGTEDHQQSSDHNQLVVDHCAPQGPASYDGGWLARFAALLVGEDPTQSYALICGNCNMHNGLARKEDFPYVTYYCPHCRALNRAKQSEELIPEAPSQPISCSATPVAPRSSSMRGGNDDVANVASGSVIDSVANVASGSVIDSAANVAGGSAIDSVLEGNSPTKAGSEIEEVTENAVAGDQ